MPETMLPHQHSDEEHLIRAKAQLDHVESFQKVADIFKQLGDASRLRIFWFLCHNEECVINIAAMMDMTTPAVSHHLRQLRASELISSRRDGKEVYYKASDTEGSRLLHLTIEQVMQIACPDFEPGKQRQSLCGTPEPGQRQTELAALIRQIHDDTMEHLNQRMTIDELSRHYHINTTTLKTAFKEVYGTSIAAHIKEHRMEKAAALLRDTEERVAEIAASVGYENQSKFTAAFKETYGMLPTEYRKRQTG